MSSLYIYGIVGVGMPLTFAVDGLAGELRLIGEGGIAAIVGAAPSGCDFHGLQREEAVRFLLPHQQVLEAAVAQTTVLPVKFGTLAPDEVAVRRMLAVGSELLGEQLKEFDGRLQMDVAVQWALDQVFTEIASEPGVADLRAKAQASSDVEARVQLGEAVKVGLDRRRAALTAEICGALRAVSANMHVNPLTDDRMVVNVALLMDRSNLGVMDATLERLDAATGGKLGFRCIGPLPPASFATVEVNFPPREVIDWARRTLGLGTTATASDIKSAYHRLAREHHPDAASLNALDDTRMGELSKAYRFLMICAKTCALGEDGDLQLDGNAGLVVLNILRPDTSASAPTKQEAAA